MPNIGALLKEEISRLARKEVRNLVDSTRKATAQHRRHIAALKREVSQLERQVDLLSRKVLGAKPAASTETTAKRSRFVPKGLRSHRIRLGLSAAEYGKLVGVSSQSIYNWESESSHPREGQLAMLAAVRAMGKKEAAARLAQLESSEARER